MVQKTLGLELANMSDDLRKKYKIKDAVKGVVITGVDANSAAAEKRLDAGDVDRRGGAGGGGRAPTTCRSASTSSRRTAGRPRCCWSPNAEGEVRFVALSLQ